jgi:ferredoxin, 2Fe-2S
VFLLELFSYFCGLNTQVPFFMAKVTFLFEDKSKPSIVYDNAQEGYSILEITEEADVHLNHNCGGVCACSTCHIYVESGEQWLEEITDKEEDFIDRAINPRLESRLACQAVILDAKAEIVVTVPDQSRIIGHEH